jgi:hypothetical protein
VLKHLGIGKIVKKTEQLEHNAADESKTHIEEAIDALNQSNNNVLAKNEMQKAKMWKIVTAV